MESSRYKLVVQGYSPTGSSHSDSKTIYKISITKGNNTWEIDRSFTQVVEFNGKMAAILPKLPKLPKKTTLSVTKAADLEKRKEELDQYLCEIICKEELQTNNEFIKFFEIEQNSGSKAINSLRLVFRKTHEVFGYRDICFWPEHHMMFGVTSSKQGGFFKSETTVGKEDGGKTIHAGDLQAWMKSSGKSSILDEYERLWHLHFKAKSVCVYFDKPSMTIYNGWENGDIIGFVLDPKRPQRYRQTVKGTYHKGKVIGIWADGEKNHVYSIGEDKMLNIIDVDSQKVVRCKFFC
jgi:hypothetical protein